MADKLDFTKFTELVLARIHEAEQREGPTAFFDVQALMADLVPPAPADWVWQAVKHLGDEGLVEAALTMQGTAHALLTPRGRIYVENDEGTGIIGKYLGSPQIVIVTGDGNQVAVGHGQSVSQAVQGSFSKEEATELLDEAESRIEQDDSLQAEERAELKADLASVRAQVDKKNPNFGAIRLLLPALQATNSIADIVTKLHSLLS